MEIVAESQETVRMPITDRVANAYVDPSSNNSRTISVALMPQGTYPSSFPISGTWEIDANTNPDSYWVTFISPGTLVRGTKYVVYVKLGSLGGETPILQAPGFLDAV